MWMQVSEDYGLLTSASKTIRSQVQVLFSHVTLSFFSLLSMFLSSCDCPMGSPPSLVNIKSGDSRSSVRQARQVMKVSEAPVVTQGQADKPRPVERDSSYSAPVPQSPLEPPTAPTSLFVRRDRNLTCWFYDPYNFYTWQLCLKFYKSEGHTKVTTGR